ncbi:hypothetical protein Tco_1580741 [Tanacetum coccineum]
MRVEESSVKFTWYEEGGLRLGDLSRAGPTARHIYANFRKKFTGIHKNVQGIPVPAWPYEGTLADLLTQDQAGEIPNTSSQPMLDIAEPEPE